MLTELGLVDVETRPWQVYYDLLLARKPGPWPGPTSLTWPDSARCPACGDTLTVAGDELTCTGCATRYPWLSGAWKIG
jgi:hypothetical protein